MSQANTIQKVYPYLRVKGAEETVEFYTQAFGSKKSRLTDSSGKIRYEWMLGHEVEKVEPEECSTGMMPCLNKDN